jgi:hypothetical protein
MKKYCFIKTVYSPCRANCFRKKSRYRAVIVEMKNKSELLMLRTVRKTRLILKKP